MASVTKRGKNYRIKVSCGYDSEGKQVIKSMTYTPSAGMTAKQIEKEVQRQAVLFEERCNNGLYGNGNFKLSEFIDKWFNNYAEQNLKAKTIKGYQDASVRVKEYLGHIRINKLQPLHIIEFYNYLQNEGMRRDTKYKATHDIISILKERNITQSEFCKQAGVSESTIRSLRSNNNVTAHTAEKINTFLSGSYFASVNTGTALSSATVRYHHAFLSTVLSWAVKWQVITANPCDRVEPPKVIRKEATIIDDEQSSDLIEKLQNAPLVYRAFIMIVLFSGMRRGEVLGLEWSDIDFDNNLINIEKTSLYLSGRGIYEDRPKNETSERIIKLPTECMKLLKELKKHQTEQRLIMGDQWINSGKIFTQRNGKPMHPSTPTSWFKKFLAKTYSGEGEFPDIHIHSLRHTNASLLIANKTDIRTVAKRLGHTDATTTARIYSHAIRKADEMASDVLDDLFFGKKVK